MTNEKVVFTVAGYEGCGYFSRATSIAKELAKNNNDVSYNVLSFSRSEYMNFIQKELQSKSIPHRTSPAVWQGDAKSGEFIGGASEFGSFVKTNFNDRPKRSSHCLLQ
mmetsp:Transcript_20355/g.36208  ORF Transcript_20355/g.36208 Transcript_20355/m.36208 type:complete len:108 (-) Transcript_20355:73-396(-)